MSAHRETYLTSAPGEDAAVQIETDPGLPEVEISTVCLLDQPDIGAALDASAVAAIVRQLTTWLERRALG